MTKTQEIWVRKMHATGSSNYFNRTNKDKINKIKRVEDIIQDLERYGPASLIHIFMLSDIIGKCIKIWYGNFNSIIGREKTGQLIDIEYHATNSEQIGQFLVEKFQTKVYKQKQFIKSYLRYFTLK